MEDCADDSPSGPPTVSVSVKPSTILEGGSETTATFTISASEELSHPVTLIAEISGTAQFGTDYEILEVSSDVFTVTLPAQPSLPEVTFSAKILDDDLMEFAETIRFSIDRETPDSVEIGVAEAILTIEDNDFRVEISCAQYATPEVVFITNRGVETVALAGWTLMEEQLGLSRPASYTFPDGATITPGETIGVYTVDGEGILYSFGLSSNRIWNNSGGDIAVLINAQGHEVSRFVPVEDCTDDSPSGPPTVSVSVKPSTILEGGSETTATFTISASEELSHPITLIAEISGTAQFGTDYEIFEVSSDVFTVTLPAQPSLPEVTFSAKILDDDLMEFAETIRFSIDRETPDSVEIGVAEAILTIEDNDFRVEISCAQYATPEVVFITNRGVETVALAGWTLMEEQLGLSRPASYTFPDGSTIASGETIGVYTVDGEGITYSFGRSSNRIWNNSGGDIAVLINAQGHEVSRFVPVSECLVG